MRARASSDVGSGAEPERATMYHAAASMIDRLECQRVNF
jgi:hypothetical protein